MNWTPSGLFKTSVGAAILALIAAVGFGWAASQKLNEVLNTVAKVEVKVSQTDAKIQAIADGQWTYTEQKLWAYEFERQNQGKGIMVPIPETKSRARVQ